MVKVLIVEDSAVIREFLIHILNSDPAIKVVGAVADGDKAVEAVERFKPQVVVMDIHMPKVNGLAATRRIMESCPLPVIVVTASTHPQEVAATFNAMESGAVAIMPKPTGPGHPGHAGAAAELIQTIKLMSEVKVVRRRARLPDKTVAAAVPPSESAALGRRPVNIVAIGGSTGAPVVIQTILSGLSKDFPASVLVVQHMAVGFLGGFVEWLNQSSDLPVHLAGHGDQLRMGHVYVAPDGFQMKVKNDGTVSLTGDMQGNGHCPSVSSLFRSVAEVYGETAVGVLLSGMGRDGAEELRLMRDKGAVTLVQSRESCVVFGMPGEAVKAGAAHHQLSPERIAALLSRLVNTNAKLTPHRQAL